MGGKPKPRVSEKELTKGQLRKFSALRKSLGDDIAEKAFAQWLASSGADGVAANKNTDLIVEALYPLVKSKNCVYRAVAMPCGVAVAG